MTKDALPFAKTVGNRARIYGINTIGLMRRGFSQDTITKLRRAYRVLLHSNTSRAVAQIERDPALQAPEVAYVVDFIQSSKRGVGLRRPSRGWRKSSRSRSQVLGFSGFSGSHECSSASAGAATRAVTEPREP